MPAESESANAARAFSRLCVPEKGRSETLTSFWSVPSPAALTSQPSSILKEALLLEAAEKDTIILLCNVFATWFICNVTSLIEHFVVGDAKMESFASMYASIV